MTTEILTDLKGENNKAFGLLYKAHFGMVQRYVTHNSGGTNDAEDIFQDTMLVLLEKLRRDDFELTASIKTYIMAIAKNLWLKKLRTKHRAVSFTALHDLVLFDEINQAIEQERSLADKLRRYIHKITKHCKGLIHDIFFREKTMEQIQKEYGYSTRHNAQNQKHKCVEQIRKIKKEEEQKDL